MVESIDALENGLREGGNAHALVKLTGLKECELTQQVMAVRRFPVPDPGTQPADDPRCTYMVSYEGPAEDLNAWLGHFIYSHPPIMARFPGIREIEIYTRMDYRGSLPVAAAQQSGLRFARRVERRAGVARAPRDARRLQELPAVQRRESAFPDDQHRARLRQRLTRDLATRFQQTAAVLATRASR